MLGKDGVSDGRLNPTSWTFNTKRELVAVASEELDTSEKQST